MTQHLGDRVAAFVDGQLPAAERDVVAAHLQDCPDCRRAVRDQQRLKDRVTASSVPSAAAPPQGLLASLADLDRVRSAALERPGTWSRVRGSTGLRSVVAMATTSVAVAVVAYAVGAPADDADTAVSPPVDRYTADFESATPGAQHTAAGTSTTVATAVGVAARSADDLGSSPYAVRLLRRAAAGSYDASVPELIANYGIVLGRVRPLGDREVVQVLATEGDRVAASFWVERSATDGPRLLRRVVYAADGSPTETRTFAVAAPTSGATGSPISSSRMDDLTAAGWPCHETLASALHRTQGRWVESDGEQVVSLTYTDGLDQVVVYEQRGTLDPGDLVDDDGFESRQVGDGTVWLRDGSPAVAVWSAHGVVYTVVTDADVDRLVDVVADLPLGGTEQVVTTTDRVRTGLDRMSSWVDPL